MIYILQQINCCGNVWTNGKEMPKSLVQTMGLKLVMKRLL